MSNNNDQSEEIPDSSKETTINEVESKRLNDDVTHDIDSTPLKKNISSELNQDVRSSEYSKNISRNTNSPSEHKHDCVEKHISKIIYSSSKKNNNLTIAKKIISQERNQDVQLDGVEKNISGNDCESKNSLEVENGAEDKSTNHNSSRDSNIEIENSEENYDNNRVSELDEIKKMKRALNISAIDTGTTKKKKVVSDCKNSPFHSLDQQCKDNHCDDDSTIVEDDIEMESKSQTAGTVKFNQNVEGENAENEKCNISSDTNISNSKYPIIPHPKCPNCEKEFDIEPYQKHTPIMSMPCQHTLCYSCSQSSVEMNREKLKRPLIKSANCPIKNCLSQNAFRYESENWNIALMDHVNKIKHLFNEK